MSGDCALRRVAIGRRREEYAHRRVTRFESYGGEIVDERREHIRVVGADVQGWVRLHCCGRWAFGVLVLGSRFSVLVLSSTARRTRELRTRELRTLNHRTQNLRTPNAERRTLRVYPNMSLTRSNRFRSSFDSSSPR